MQDKTEGAMRTLSSIASKWAPTWHSCTITPNSLSGQPLNQVWIRLSRNGFWGNHTAMSCGGLFRSSWCADFHSALSFVLHFFYLPRFPSGTMWQGLFESSGQVEWPARKIVFNFCSKMHKKSKNFTHVSWKKEIAYNEYQKSREIWSTTSIKW